MAAFIGEFECKLDDKARLSVPAALRKQLDAADKEQFVINRGLSGYLNLYPMSSWERVMDKLRKLNRFKAKDLKFIRMFQNGATKVEVDGNGRVLLPKNLLEYAGITKEVVLVPNIDQFEIWDKARYHAMINEGYDEFGSLAEDVMGNLGGDDE
jgi:MraZ protein